MLSAKLFFLSFLSFFLVVSLILAYLNFSSYSFCYYNSYKNYEFPGALKKKIKKARITGHGTRSAIGQTI